MDDCDELLINALVKLKSRLVKRRRETLFREHCQQRRILLGEENRRKRHRKHCDKLMIKSLLQRSDKLAEQFICMKNDSQEQWKQLNDTLANISRSVNDKWDGIEKRIEKFINDDRTNRESDSGHLLNSKNQHGRATNELTDSLVNRLEINEKVVNNQNNFDGCTSDTTTYQHSIPRPTGPRKLRDYLLRMNIPINDAQSRDGHKGSGSSFGISSIIISVCIFLGSCVLAHILTSNETEICNKIETISPMNDRMNDLLTDINDLKGFFPSQDSSTWQSFHTGIFRVLMGQHSPAVFLLISLHDKTTGCVARVVAESASRTLGGTGNVILTPDEFENNRGQVFRLMENRMRRTKAAVIPDLLGMPPEAIKMLYDICRPDRPLVAEAVYLFTIRPRTSVESEDLENLVYEELRQKFLPVIEEDRLKALVTRITAGAVMVIKEEEDIPCLE